MQLFSYNPHPFIFIASPSFMLLNKILYCFSYHFLASQHVFIVFLACFLTYAIIYRFDVVGLAFLGQDMSKFNVYAQIYRPMSSLPPICLDLCWLLCLNLMFVLRLTNLCVIFFPYAQIYVFMCSVPCFCAQIYIGCYVMCSITLLSLDISLSRVLTPIGGVQIQIQWSRPTSTYLGLHQRVRIIFFMHVYVCLLISRSRLCHALCPPWACLCGYIRLSQDLFGCNCIHYILQPL